jgi:hypothetical protein
VSAALKQIELARQMCRIACNWARAEGAIAHDLEPQMLEPLNTLETRVKEKSAPAKPEKKAP